MPLSWNEIRLRASSFADFEHMVKISGRANMLDETKRSRRGYIKLTGELFTETKKTGKGRKLNK
jgi:hypothetical protein